MISTFSSFYYGSKFTTLTNYISFDEGSGEILAQVSVRNYTLTDIATEVARAMSSAGGQEYTATVNRVDRTITISATSNFSLLVSSGTATNSAYGEIGFTGSDRSGSNTYTGNLSVGSAFYPQFRLQDYIDFEDNQSAIESNVSESATGIVESINFGTKKIMECNIDYITDKSMDDSYIKTNLSGISDARNFLVFCITKGELEFMPDRNTPNTFTKVILESTPESNKGTGFRLKEKYSDNLPGFFETGLLKFRKVES